MYLRNALRAATAISLVAMGTAHAETITIATVNNGDMIRMQGYTDDFTAKTGHEVEWVTLEENVLRQRVTTDITTKGGQFDIMTIGMYETPIWGANGWLVPLDDLSAEYDVGDILPAMAGGLSYDGTLYAAPFYGESSMIMYRTDLMEAAGLEMPDAPTWEFIREAASAMTDRDNEINGVCLRGKAGWGEGGAFITAMSNSFGARWFDMDWNAQFDTQPWADTLNFFVGMMSESGPAGYATNGFNQIPDHDYPDRIMNLLFRERDMLKNGDFEGMEALIADKESALRGLTNARLDADALVALKREAETNDRLLAMARSTMQAVIARIRQLRTGDVEVNSYTQSGQKKTLNANQSAVVRKA